MSTYFEDLSCSVLVPSCDNYSDMWAPFFYLFFKFWPDCPFPVFLGSGTFDFPNKRVKVLYSNQEKNWTNCVRQYLSTINTDYVLLCLEDFFMRKPISTKDIVTAFNTLKNLNGTMLRLVPYPAPDKNLSEYPNIGSIAIGAPFRVSTQTAISKRQALLDLMREVESIWEFEVNGSRRSDALGNSFYGVWNPLMTYKHHVVERGKWFPQEARRFGRMNIGCDFTKREIMKWHEMLKWRFGKIIWYPFHKLPWKMQYFIEDGARFILGRKKRIK